MTTRDEERMDYAPAYAAPLIGFRSRKAAQLSATFALKNSGIIEKLKLIKLIYLSEREFLFRHELPMLFDEFYSLPHGPICSSTLNGINGIIHEAVWDEFVARNGNKIVALKRFGPDEMDEISTAEWAVIDEIWKKFGHMTASQLRNYTHQSCSEYTETTGRIPISYKQVLESLGNMDADQIDQEINEMRKTESLLIG